MIKWIVAKNLLILSWLFVSYYRFEIVSVFNLHQPKPVLGRFQFSPKWIPSSVCNGVPFYGKLHAEIFAFFVVGCHKMKSDSVCLLTDYWAFFWYVALCSFCVAGRPAAVMQNKTVFTRFIEHLFTANLQPQRRNIIHATKENMGNCIKRACMLNLITK